ncbi:MAG: 50S ribosomal protein L23 [bacterium]|nr:50S ribosomal protein L23 [bacterium]MDZ4299467.1 50S ribosomal protein L23 [Candidatus Sungbacteria bacterium]
MALFSRIKKEEQGADQTTTTYTKKVHSPRAARSVVEKSERRPATLVLLPHLTEKTSAGAARRHYTFRVDEGVNKPQVKRAVEGEFGVTVTQVRMANMPDKMLRRGKQTGWRAGLKKATVTLAEGQAIEIP